MLLAISEAGPFKVCLIVNGMPRTAYLLANKCVKATLSKLQQLISVSCGLRHCGVSDVSCMQVVVLMRQVVPYTWLNYAASAPPEITLPWYMLASVIGQIPHNAVDVYLGGNVTGLGDLLA